MITGGEPTLRADIEELVEAARFKYKFRSLLLITNGTLLDRKPKILNAVTGLVVSLDALRADPTNPLSKPAALPKVMENLQFAKERLGNPRRITISTVIEEWNIAEVERLLDWCGEQGFVFAAQSAQMEKMPNLALLKNPRSIRRWWIRSSSGGARTSRRLTERRGRSRRCCDFGIFECLSDDVSAGVSEWGCVLSLRASAEDRGESFARWIAARRYSRRGRRSTGIFRRARGFATCLGMCFRTIT